jgi:hypothetical protein
MIYEDVGIPRGLSLSIDTVFDRNYEDEWIMD